LGLQPEQAVAEQAPELRPEWVVAERELAAARPEQRAEAGALGAAEQFIARMVKRNLRSALGVWF
jgi:hypothetical protein